MQNFMGNTFTFEMHLFSFMHIFSLIDLLAQWDEALAAVYRILQNISSHTV